MIKEKLLQYPSRQRTAVLLAYLIEKYAGLDRNKPKPIATGDWRKAEVAQIANELGLSVGMIAGAIKMYTFYEQYENMIIECEPGASRVSIITGNTILQKVNQHTIDQAKASAASKLTRPVRKRPIKPKPSVKASSKAVPTIRKKRTVVVGNSQEKATPTVTIRKKRKLTLKR